MKRTFLFSVLTISFFCAGAQNVLTPELLWKLGRINPIGISKDSENVVFSVSFPNVEANKSSKKTYKIFIKTGETTEIPETTNRQTCSLQGAITHRAPWTTVFRLIRFHSKRGQYEAWYFEKARAS